MKPEQQIEKYLEKLAKQNDFLYYKYVSPGNRGVPDRTLIGHGHTIFVELKAPGGKPRILQKKIIKKMREHGADVRVISEKQQCEDLINELIGKGVNKSCRAQNCRNENTSPFK